VSWLCWNAHRPVNRPIQVRFQTHNPIFSGLDGADRRLGEISSLQQPLDVGVSVGGFYRSVGDSADLRAIPPSGRDTKSSQRQPPREAWARLLEARAVRPILLHLWQNQTSIVKFLVNR